MERVVKIRDSWKDDLLARSVLKKTSLTPFELSWMEKFPKVFKYEHDLDIYYNLLHSENKCLIPKNKK